MFKFSGRVKENKLDTEIDEFGDIKSIDVENDNVEVSYKRDFNPKAIERLKYDRTGISQLGTTYPQTYDREEFIKLSKKPLNWYCSDLALILITSFIVIVDFMCYLFMLNNQQTKNGEDFNYSILLVAIGIAIAIDLLPIFIAHNLHRQAVDRKKVLKGFNILCIVLVFIFVLSIFIYRLLNGEGDETVKGTMELMTNSESEEINSNPFINFLRLVTTPFLYVLIPFATSLLCFILNYLSYNPIVKKIQKKKKELLVKQEDVNELKAVITEIESENDYYGFLKDKDDTMYNSAFDMIESISDYYKSYVRTELMIGLRSPADTTDLSNQ